MNIVIVGAGDVGSYISQLLSQEQHNVIVIDKDKRRLEALSQNFDIATRAGSGTDWQLLDDLIELTPDVFIALTDSEETNLAACSIAKHLGYPLTICRVRGSKFLNRTRLDFGRIFDIDYFLSPELLVAQDIVKYIDSEGAVAVEHFAHGAVQLRTLLIPPKWDQAQIPLYKLKLPEGMMVGLIYRAEPQPQVIFPHGNDVLQPGDEATFIGEADAIEDLQKIMGEKSHPIQSVVIVGATLTGMHLARLLDRRNLNVRLIEKEYEKCVELSDQLPGITILHHDATDADFLRSEKIELADLVVACTRHDEVNLLVAQLCKEFDCRDVLAVLSNASFAPLLNRYGIRHVSSPRLSAANRILSHLYTGTVTSLISLYDNKAEVLELMVSADSRIVGIPIGELGPLLPRDFLIAMIQNRGRIMVANGNRIVSPGDTVIVITSPQHVSELETIF